MQAKLSRMTADALDRAGLQVGCCIPMAKDKDGVFVQVTTQGVLFDRNIIGSAEAKTAEEAVQKIIGPMQLDLFEVRYAREGIQHRLREFGNEIEYLAITIKDLMNADGT